MKPNYFNSVGSLESHAQNFPCNSFAINPQPRTCGCGTVRIAYEITDKEDNDILEILVVCPHCTNQTKNNQ